MALACTEGYKWKTGYLSGEAVKLLDWGREEYPAMDSTLL